MAAVQRLLSEFDPPVLIPVLTVGTLAVTMSFAPRIGPVLLFLAIAATLLSLWLQRRFAPKEARLHIRPTVAKAGPAIGAALIFLGMSWISVAYATDPDFALSRMTRLTPLWLGTILFALLAIRANPAEGRLLDKTAFIAVLGFGVASGALLYAHTVIAPTKPSADAFINRTVVVLVLFGFLSAAYLSLTTWTRTVRLGVSSAIALLAVWSAFASNSQTSVVALAAGLIMGGACLVLSPRIRVGLVVAMAGLLFAMPVLVQAIAVVPDAVFSQAFLSGASAGHRLAIWESYLVLVQEKPWFGWGIEGSREFDPARLSETQADALSFSSHPHNAFLQMWTDLGAFGALIAAVLVASVGLMIDRVRPRAQPAAYGLFFAAVTAAAVSHGAFQSWWMASLGILLVAILPLRQLSD